MPSELLLGFIGTLFGFALSELATYLHTMQQDRKQARNVRAILRLEMQQNLHILNSLMADFKAEDESNETVRRHRALRLLELPAPRFSEAALSSQMALLAAALREDEISGVFTHYEQFAHLKTLRAELARLQDLQRQSFAAARPEPGKAAAPLMGTPFNDRSPDLWQTYAHTARSLLTNGVPLKK